MGAVRGGNRAHSNMEDEQTNHKARRGRKTPLFNMAVTTYGIITSIYIRYYHEQANQIKTQEIEI